MDDDEKKQRLEATRQQRYGIYASADSWGLEALKHVAIVGSAGLAAVFALRAGNALHDAKDALWPAACFAVGTVAATLAMALGYKQRETILKIYLEAESLLSDQETDTGEYRKLQWISELIRPWVARLGVLGIILDIAGGILLFRAL